MTPILRGRQPSKSILRIFLGSIVSVIVLAVGTWAGTSMVNSQDRFVTRLTGIVSDTDCGSTHGTKIHGDAACTRLCISLGAEYALADGTRIYILRGHPAELNAFAGELVVVRGKIVNRNTVEVESVDPYLVSTVKNLRSVD